MTETGPGDWAEAAAAAPVALVLTAADGRIRGVNAAAAALFGVGAEALCGAPFARVLAVAAELPAEGAPVETLGLRGDGAVFAIELAAGPATGGGRVIACRDLTGGTGTGAGARGFLQTLIDDQDDLVIRSDADFRILFCNLAVCRFFGQDRAALTGHRFTPGMTPEEEAALAADLSALTPERPWRSSIDTKRHPSGELRRIAWSNRALFDAGGRVTGHLSIGRDVTHAEETRAALERSEAAMTAFANHAPAAMVLRDADGLFRLVNDEAAALFGRPRADILAQGMQIAPPALALALAAAARSQPGPGGTVTAEFSLAPPGAPWHAAVLFLFPVAVPGAVQPWSGCILVDFSARKAAEEELARATEALARAERMNAMGALLAGVAHELNNPLAVVVAQAAMLEQDARDGALADRANRIHRAAARAGRIVQAFLGLARQRPGTRGPLLLADLGRAAAELLAYGFRSSGVALTLALDEPAAAEGDAGLLTQALSNLLVNAQGIAERSAPPLAVTMTTSVGEGEARIEVRVGAAADEPYRAFIPAAGAGPGAAAGLVFCHGIAEAEGGRMQMAGQGSPGTRWRLALPLRAPTAAPVAGRAAPPGLALVVDDDEALAETLADLLASGGWDVDVATSAAAAQALIAGGGHSVIFSDLRMPGMDGPAFYHWLAAEHPDLADRIGFVTGDTLGESSSQFLADAGRPVLEKPFTRAMVLDLAARLAR